MKKDLILVIGANGTVGSLLIQQLKAQGYSVRAATSRAPQNRDQVKLNLATGEGLREAFEGVERAFLLSPPGFADQYSILSPLIQESKRRGLKKVVLMTAMGANAVATSPFRRAEIELEKSGLNFNIIRPNWFMQNFHTFWVQGIREQGKILLPAGSAKTSFIDASDIAAVAAKLLTSDRWNNRDFDLTGPEDLDHQAVAQKISEATGKQISYEEISPSAFLNALLGAALPKDYAEFLGMIMGFLREGYSSGVRATVRELLDRAPKNFNQYAQENKKSWL